VGRFGTQGDSWTSRAHPKQRALLSVAMQQNGSYWQGVQGRLQPALAVGLIPAVILWWLDDIATALFVGLATFAAAALLPSRPPRGGRA
jgi:hypothetical protein